jgi:hypothetical protein
MSRLSGTLSGVEARRMTIIRRRFHEVVAPPREPLLNLPDL